MTEEEYFRKNYPDSCYGDRPLSPHWDFFEEGVEFGERQSEKKIAELEKENAELKKKIGIYQKGMFDEIEKRDKKVIKATELFELFIQWSYGCCKEPDYKNLVKQAEQFLQEIKK